MRWIYFSFILGKLPTSVFNFHVRAYAVAQDMKIKLNVLKKFPILETFSFDFFIVNS